MVFLAPLIWGTTFSIIKRALQDSTPMAFATVRFALAILLFALISPAARKGYRYLFLPKTKAEKRFRMDMIILGLSLAGGYVFQTVGLLTTTTSKSAFLTSTTIIWTPIYCMLLGWDKPSIKIGISVAVTIGGVFLMTHPFAQGGFLIGDLLSVLCAMTFGVFILWIHHALPRTMELVKNELDGAMMIGSANTLVATIIMLILMPFIETPHLGLTQFTVGSIVYTAIFGTLVTGFIQARYQNVVSPSAASIIFMLEPVVAMGISLVLLHEHMGTEEVLGALLIVGGIVITQIGSSASAIQPKEAVEFHEI